MKRFMVVYWYYNSRGELCDTGVIFYDSLADARRFIYATISTGDKAQLYMLRGDGPEYYYVYCNE